jgi:hypothetical protein
VANTKILLDIADLDGNMWRVANGLDNADVDITRYRLSLCGKGFCEMQISVWLGSVIRSEDSVNYLACARVGKVDNSDEVAQFTKQTSEDLFIGAR